MATSVLLRTFCWTMSGGQFANDEIWAIRYLIVNTNDWLFGKKVLVAPHWAHRVDREIRNVYVAMSRQSIRDCL